MRIIDTVKKNGSVYTPRFLGDYVASLLLNYYTEHNNGVGPTHLNVIDPACGSGELLHSMLDEIEALNNKLHRGNGKSKQWSVSLYGVDTDKTAIVAAQRNMNKLRSSGYTFIRNQRFANTNALFPYRRPRDSGWPRLRKTFGFFQGFDLVIANPPWGADTKEYDHLIKQGEYILGHGQYDTADLFLELAHQILKPTGVLAFIVPDSIFYYENTAIRKFILERFEILYLARLGEKIFPNINRGCSILICKNRPPDLANFVDCFRLRPTQRREVVLGEKKLKEVSDLEKHGLPQARFAQNPNFEFDLEVREKDNRVLKKLMRGQNLIGHYLESSRGVELSKRGRVCQCKVCELWMPLPTIDSFSCRHCGAPLQKTNLETMQIISRDERFGYWPIIVGENVSRYQIEPNYWISLHAEGIRYKSFETYQGPKILVRKTGVGITASLDYSNSLTNQVVYILKAKKSESSNLPLEFFLAVLNSRALYYYNVLHTGETEWRSHPYLTQKQILNLPLPFVNNLSPRVLQQIDRVSELADKLLKNSVGLPQEADAEIERNLAGLFGLTRNDYRRIFEVLDFAESLLPVRRLQNLSISEIF